MLDNLDTQNGQAELAQAESAPVVSYSVEVLHPKFRLDNAANAIRKTFVPLQNFVPLKCELPVATMEEYLQMFPYKLRDNDVMVIAPTLYTLSPERIMLPEQDVRSKFDELANMGLVVLKTGKLTVEDEVLKTLVPGNRIMVRGHNEMIMDRVFNLRYHNENMYIIDENRELQKRNLPVKDTILLSEMTQHYFAYAVYIVNVFDIYGVY